jgi:hypothetical protein
MKTMFGLVISGAHSLKHRVWTTSSSLSRRTVERERNPQSIYSLAAGRPYSCRLGPGPPQRVSVVDGRTGRRRGLRCGWLKSKSLVRSPRIDTFSRTVGRGYGRPSVEGSRRTASSRFRAAVCGHLNDLNRSPARWRNPPPKPIVAQNPPRCTASRCSLQLG